jgi:O-antigen/teichoic acid export membrane protein
MTFLLVTGGGPTRYLGGSIMTFALPMGAFIVISVGLYYIFKRPHNVPRMAYLRPAHQTSIGTREPGTSGVITIAAPQPPVEGEQ